MAEPGELAQVGVLPHDYVLALGGAEDEFAAEGEARDRAHVAR